MDRKFYILFFAVLVIYVINLFIDVMAIDAAQYAEMSWEMLTTKSYLKVHAMQQDYLDKPPLLFWLNTISFSIFGVSTAAYKLPSLLFALLAIYSTYRFTKIYYSIETASTAALMLATTEALCLITNDVRTDTMLMGAVIFAIWQWAEFSESAKTKNVILGSVGIGLALLAKGPIGLIAVAAALLPHLIWQRKYRLLTDVRLLLGAVIISLLLLPMCIGLYQQWGMKGLEFYFWTQSFGRITGQSEWNNHPDTFFLLHTTAWAFLPWTLFLLSGWLSGIISLFRREPRRGEIISVSGLTLVLLALMLSKYQLPHYVFVIFPLGAVMAADSFLRVKDGMSKKAVSALQVLLLIAMVGSVCTLQYCFKGRDIISLSALILLYPVAIWTAVKYDTETGYKKLFWVSASVMIVSNFMVGAFYFPALLKYQPGDDFGRYVRAHPDKKYVSFQYGAGYSEVFYTQQMPFDTWDINKLIALLDLQKCLIVCTTPGGVGLIAANHLHYKVIEERYAYPVARLSFDFLNPATRDSVCRKVCLVTIDR